MVYIATHRTAAYCSDDLHLYTPISFLIMSLFQNPFFVMPAKAGILSNA